MLEELWNMGEYHLSSPYSFQPSCSSVESHGQTCRWKVLACVLGDLFRKVVDSKLKDECRAVFCDTFRVFILLKMSDLLIRENILTKKKHTVKWKLNLFGIIFLSQHYKLRIPKDLPRSLTVLTGTENKLVLDPWILELADLLLQA